MKWLPFVAAVLLTACAGTAAVEVTDPIPTEEPTVEETPAGETTSPTEDTQESTEADPDNTLSPGVARATSSWGTDWSQTTIDLSELISGGPPRDGIPSIDDPQYESIEEASEWLVDNDPVISVELNGEARAYPLSILTRHEIANDELGGVPIAVTFCPLCNSALVFDARVDPDAEPYDFGVSGLLRNSDLVMYDRTTESLWQQFTGEGIVGEHAGDQLVIVPSGLVGFAQFSEAHPQGTVLSRDTGIYSPAAYGTNPYAFYDSVEDSRPFLFNGEIDERLPALSRVVGVVIEDQAVAYPYSLLEEVGAVNDMVNSQPVVIFHRFGANTALGDSVIAEAEDVGATGVFNPEVDGEVLTFTVEGEDIIDEQTGSTWNVLGQATAGELEGTQLERLPSTDHFWFSWAAFFPETTIYAE
ncbi:MAG: DUF3179 domain-containing protein [Chloroflexi bacterium]|nr:DUF3179 domain-containing protein [Chloroflexota bacterium]